MLMTALGWFILIECIIFQLMRLFVLIFTEKVKDKLQMLSQAILNIPILIFMIKYIFNL